MIQKVIRRYKNWFRSFPHAPSLDLPFGKARLRVHVPETLFVLQKCSCVWPPRNSEVPHDSFPLLHRMSSLLYYLLISPNNASHTRRHRSALLSCRFPSFEQLSANLPLVLSPHPLPTRIGLLLLLQDPLFASSHSGDLWPPSFLCYSSITMSD